MVVGCISFAGSAVTFLKLQEVITGRPGDPSRAARCSSARCHRRLTGRVRRGPTRAALDGSAAPRCSSWCSPWVSVCCFVLPVGGADVPIVISLLNAFTGLTVAAGGYVLGNTLLLVAGTLVGASGTILTRVMAEPWAAR